MGILSGGAALAALLSKTPMLAKAVSGAKGLAGMGGLAGKAGTVAGVGKAHATGVAARSAIAGSKVGRFAGPKLKAMSDGLAGQMEGMTRRQMIQYFGPDIFIGGVTGAMTPGDLGDKLVAGGISGVAGAAGGVGLRAALPAAARADFGGIADLAGSFVGDAGGLGVSDAIIRAKNGGLTPAEKSSIQYEEELKQQALVDYLTTGRY